MKTESGEHSISETAYGLIRMGLFREDSPFGDRPAEIFTALLKFQLELPRIKFLVFPKGFQELRFLFEVIFNRRDGILCGHTSL